MPEHTEHNNFIWGGGKERMRENEGWIGKAKVEGERENE